MRIRSPIFVGRRAELGQLSAWLDDAAAGRPHVVVISGEAGVGKSRLVHEFSRVAADHGARWLLGAAADYGEGGLPFGAVVEALRPTGEAAFLLSGGGVGGAEDVNGANRQQVFERLLAVLVELARQQPVVLALEDIHWADASTREFLAFFARNRGAARVLAIATYRTDDVGRDHPLHRYLVELQRDAVEVIDLRRFDRGELREQLAAIREGAGNELLVTALYERSQGNAFFSEELLASTVGNELPAAVPPTLRDTMLARVDRLSTEARALIKGAAVAGTADESVLAAVSGLDDDRLAVALRETIERGVLQANDGAGYGFRHALLREATYQDMLAGERSKAHRRIAEALSSDEALIGEDPGRLAQLAHHWELAGEPQQALVAAWRAAAAADRIYAKPEAGRLYERVGELWPSVPDASQLLRAELERVGDTNTKGDRATVFHRAAASSASFNLTLGGRLARRALDFVDATTEPDRAVLLLDRVVTWSREVGRPDAAHDAEEQLERVIDRASPNLRARLLLTRSDGAIVMGHFDRAREIANGALSAAEEIGQTEELLQALIIAARANGYSARPDEADRLFDRLRREALEAGLPFYAAEADRWQGDLYQAAGRYQDAVQLLRRAAAQMATVGETSSADHALVIAGQALYRSGHWPEAAAELR